MLNMALETKYWHKNRAKWRDISKKYMKIKKAKTHGNHDTRIMVFYSTFFSVNLSFLIISQPRWQNFII